jgi:hypothetical protein
VTIDAQRVDDALDLPDMRLFMVCQPLAMHLHGSFPRLARPVTSAVRDQDSGASSCNTANSSARWAVNDGIIMPVMSLSVSAA